MKLTRVFRKKKDSNSQIDVESLKSDRQGLAGLIETTFRRFKVIVQLLFVTPLYMLCCAVVGLSLMPGVLFFNYVSEHTLSWSPLAKSFAIASTLPAGYFMYGFSLLFILPTFNWICRLKLESWRGPYYSLPAIRWYAHNAVTYLLRFTFLEFVTPTPFSNLFYQMMGMKIGRGTIINTTFISDPSLITMGEKVTIGGSVTIVGHYGQGGFLVLAPVTIGDRATIGLKASIMGGANIGQDCKILPHSVVMPKTQIPDGEIWGGVPAQKIDLKDLARTRSA